MRFRKFRCFSFQVLQNFHNADVVKKYFEENGVAAEEMTFYSVSIREIVRDIYNEEGEYIGYEDDGYITDLYSFIFQFRRIFYSTSLNKSIFS